MSREVTQAQAAQKVMSDYINNMGHKPQEFVDAMARDHRTLQQSFTQICLLWLKHCSELKEGYYDGRNEYSVQISKKLLSNVDTKYDLNTPFI